MSQLLRQREKGGELRVKWKVKAVTSLFASFTDTQSCH